MPSLHTRPANMHAHQALAKPLSATPLHVPFLSRPAPQRGLPLHARVHRSLTVPQASAAPAQQALQAQPGDQFFATDRRPVVLFDGVCNLCNGGVDTALRLDRKGALRFAALQSDAGRQLLRRSGRAPDDISSIVLVEPGASFIKSEAVLRIATHLQIPFPLLAQLGFPFPLFFRDGVYDAVANSRYNIFGKSDTCRLMTQAEKDRFLQ